MDLSRPLDLVVLAPRSNAIRCRLLGTHREITLRTAVRREVPGEIITVIPTRQWTHARHPYLSGQVQTSRLDVRALGVGRGERERPVLSLKQPDADRLLAPRVARDRLR